MAGFGHLRADPGDRNERKADLAGSGPDPVLPSATGDFRTRSDVRGAVIRVLVRELRSVAAHEAVRPGASGAHNLASRAMLSEIREHIVDSREVESSFNFGMNRKSKHYINPCPTTQLLKKKPCWGRNQC